MAYLATGTEAGEPDGYTLLAEEAGALAAIDGACGIYELYYFAHIEGWRYLGER